VAKEAARCKTEIHVSKKSSLKWPLLRLTAVGARAPPMDYWRTHSYAGNSHRGHLPQM